MTRTLAEGQITSSADSALDLYNLIATELTNHPAWSLVDTHVNGTYTFYVWKCDGVVNGVGDFHVLFGKSTNSTTNLYVMACEQYDAVNHWVNRPCPFGYSQSNTAPDPTDWSFEPSTWFEPAITDYRLKYVVLITDNTSTDYHIIVEDKNLYVAARKPTVTNIFVGLYESLLPVATVDFPLVIVSLDNTYSGGSASTRTSAAGAFSRFPHVTSTSDYYIWKAQNPVHVTHGNWTQTNENISEGDKFLDGLPWGARALVSAPAHSSNLAETYGGIRGLLPEFFLYFRAPTGVEMGDTLTVGGTTYMYTGYGSGWVSREVIA